MVSNPILSNNLCCYPQEIDTHIYFINNMYIHVYITKKTNYMYNYLLSVKKLYSISNEEHTKKK